MINASVMLNSKTTLFCLFSILFSSHLVFSQEDSLLMLNGRTFKGDIGRTNDGIISITIPKKKGKTKQFDIASYRVFSYYKDGKATTVYNQDELQGNYLSVIESHNATMGMYDARITYKPRLAFWSSFAIGLGSSIYDTYRSKDVIGIDGEVEIEKGFFNSPISVFPFFVPPTLTGIWAIPKLRVKQKHMLHNQFENDPHYYRGFNRISRQKRTLYALRGSALGVVTGILIHIGYNLISD